MNYTITQADMDGYCLSLLTEERSAGTIEKYRRDLAAFARWIGGAAQSLSMSSPPRPAGLPQDCIRRFRLSREEPSPTR